MSSAETRSIASLGFRDTVDAFLQERLQSKLDGLKAKLDKLDADDPKREQLLTRSEQLRIQYQRQTWCSDAARRVVQIQAVTHSLKAVHPDARGSNLYVEPHQLPQLQEVGSHVLRDSFSSDVVGNAAALDVYKFLKLEAGGRSLLDAMLENDPAALKALSDDPVQAGEWRNAFVSLVQPRDVQPASHALAKQLYWLTGDDPGIDTDYLLLAPLHATSLAHAVYARIQEARFGEANKAARTARREGKMHNGVLQEYADLAVQKLGGTKPQNISQLNSERRGVNYLLTSSPPSWKSRKNRLPVKAASVFDRLFGARPSVRDTLRDLRDFLQSNPPANVRTRQRRESLIDFLIDELSCMAAELQQGEPAGWTRDHIRFGNLVRSEQLWLDPGRAALDGEEAFASDWLAIQWPADIGRYFANWLNSQLDRKLPMGEIEARHWHDELMAWDSTFAEQLRRLHPKIPTANEITETAS